MEVAKSKPSVWRIVGVDIETRRMVRAYAESNGINTATALAKIVKTALSK